MNPRYRKAIIRAFKSAPIDFKKNAEGAVLKMLSFEQNEKKATKSLLETSASIEPTEAVNDASFVAPELDFSRIHYKKLVSLAVEMSAEEGNEISPFIKKKDAIDILEEMNSEGVEVASRIDKLRVAKAEPKKKEKKKLEKK